jgi:transposase-like protein
MHNKHLREVGATLIECPYCRSVNIRWRKRSPSFGCRRCGTRFDVVDGQKVGVTFQADKLRSGEEHSELSRTV